MCKVLEALAERERERRRRRTVIAVEKLMRFQIGVLEIEHRTSEVENSALVAIIISVGSRF
jgi:hypothetical protein